MSERWGVSGAHGFIGKSLSQFLEQAGNEVTPIPRSGFMPIVDRVVDLAAYGNMYNQIDPIAIYQANVFRVIDILNRGEGLKSIVLTSTSAVELPHQTLYSASKKAMEEVAQIYARDRKLPIIIVRPFSVYGPGEQKEHLIPKLIDSCLNGTEMPFVGEPKHDFIYISDLVDILTLPLDKIFPGTVIEAGTGISTSNEEVKDIVEKVTGKKANLKRVESLRNYDTTEWKAPLKFHKYITLEEGIRRMVYGE